MSATPKVALFIQCLIDGLYPEVGQAVVRLFEKLDVPLSYPSNQTCCGQPAFNSGYRKEATIAAKRFIGIFEKAEAIVCPSGSCVNMVRNHYPELFQEDSEWLSRAQKVAAKTFELTEYLVDILGERECEAFVITVFVHCAAQPVDVARVDSIIVLQEAPYPETRRHLIFRNADSLAA